VGLQRRDWHREDKATCGVAAPLLHTPLQRSQLAVRELTKPLGTKPQEQFLGGSLWFRFQLFRGPSGVGKTTLAKHLGLAALERGHSVRFATLAEVLADLLKQESAPAIERRLRRYVLPDVLILDEVGYLPCDADAANLLYAIIDRRHEKRATIVTTNLSFKQWGTVFPGAACVVALVDRFAQHCHVIDIDADSWRQRHALSRDGAEAPAAAPLPARAAARPTRARA